jgi:benzylsuccinate CoA-transferase BbsF subunit
VTVIDFGQLTAGANTSAMLADLGADVIKVESAASMDLFRAVGRRDTEPGWWNRSPQFRFTNRNKRGVAIDMKAAAGRRLILDLIARSDVVVENFRRGVLERVGLDYASLVKVNPRIVLASISSQGETGPNRLHGSFGSTLDATGGIAALTGYAGGKPTISGMDVNYPDQVVSLFAAGLIVAALREAIRTGHGAHLDISQREVTSFLIGEEILAAAADAGRKPMRNGNAAEGVALQDCFRGSDGRWAAVTLADDADLARAATAIGTTVSHEALAAWCAARPAREAATTLMAAGLAAAPVLDGMDLLHETALAGHTLLTAANGDLVKGMPYCFGGRALAIREPAPDLGQHTAAVLRDLLGLDEASLQELIRLGVTRAEPDNP